MSTPFAAELEMKTREPMAPLTSFGIGGSAEFFSEPASVDELSSIAATCVHSGIPMRVLGGGSNLLVADSGVRGLVLKLGRLNAISRDEDVVICDAGVLLPRLVREAQRWGLGGLEPLAGIPGTVGGAITMNAGGNHGWINSVIKSVTMFDPATGDVVVRERDQLRFSYRQLALDGRIILRAEFALKPADSFQIGQRLAAIIAQKQRTQPMSAMSAGCVFRNPGEIGAGKLIDDAGMKSRRVGHAVVSPVHANFIVNEGGATAADVRTLIEQVRERVLEKFGVHLQLEIKIWD